MRSPRIADPLVALAVASATVVPVLLAPGRWWVVLLALFASVPVLWRRRAPVPVTLVVGAATSALVLWQKPLLLPWGPLVGVYTVAALSRPLVRLVSLPVTVAAVYVSLALPRENTEVYPLMGTAFFAAFALGTAEHARRSQAAEHAERARRLEQERTAAVVRERARIARDMHDIVTHSVGLMVVQAEAGPFARRADSDATDRRDAQTQVFDLIADTGRATLTQLRALLGVLREIPAGVLQPGLDTLGDLVRAFELPVRLTVEGAPRTVPPEVGVAAYRIVQEALTNVRKHAAAGAVSVQVRWGGDLEIEVSDDGRGGTPRPGGQGIIGMHERAKTCGGSVRTGPGPRGFTVLARFPVERASC
ncbi:sensor histidine kinase [Streptomyces sp. IBSBF 2953]|uniref:histidine kinase n=1 Tax=Streptomyces TaxID=1883 RepID=UPI00211A4648|nr:histidine kinase [Streptomyces scabiei]MCQ9180977.1 sensor histidine kinase [Streptomyces hayashii]MDX3113244.1 histidine kinase [Streptomyces scabiei]